MDGWIGNGSGKLGCQCNIMISSPTSGTRLVRRPFTVLPNASYLVLPELLAPSREFCNLIMYAQHLSSLTLASPSSFDSISSSILHLLSLQI